MGQFNIFLVLKVVLLYSCLLYLVVGVYLFIFQKKYIYFPLPQDFYDCPNFANSQKLNLNSTRVYYKKNSDKLVVFYHGNAGSACDRVFMKNKFESLNYSYIFVEYTGYANDSPKPSKKILMQDVRNVNDFIKNLGYQKLVLAGESLGASLALYHSSLIDEDKVLLISPFYKLSDVAKVHYSWYPVSWMLLDNYDNSEWVDNVNNLLIVHGENDEIIPIEHSRKLFDKANAVQKNFVALKNTGHNDMFLDQESFNPIADFLKN